MTAESTFQVNVRGMTCASCAAGLERALARVAGVRRVAVVYATELATVEAAAPGVRADVEARIRALGYEVTASQADDAALDDERLLAVRLAITTFFAMSAMLPSGALLFGVESAGSPAVARALCLASALLAAPALAVGGAPIAARALRSIRAGAPGMDLLVAVGALVTFVHSAVVLARGGHETFFDTAAMIVTFALLGRLLEARARRRGLGAVRALDALQPSGAHLVEPGSSGTREVRTDTLRVGDVVRVRAGERVPVDGLVASGAAFSDAAILTGEWAPRAVGAGDRVAAGVLLHDGALDVAVERVVGHREVDLIRRAVDGLVSSRAPMQRFADAFSLRFAWLVLAAAALTLVATGARSGFGPHAWMRAVAVVVVACPCALGLATPMAIVVTAGRAASRGILFRDAEAIELAADIDRIFVDKTGTLTAGHPRVVAVHTAPGVDEGEILSMASLLEGAVEHPLARALREAAPPAEARLQISVSAGGGVVGRGASTWVVGSGRFLRSHGIAVVEERDATTVHVARDGVWLASIALEDELRPGAAGAVSALGAEGLPPVLLTGDSPGAAARIARAAGIAEVHAGVSPLEKAALVTAARRRGERVAFVGDGLNDGPALAAADLGIAVDGATALAVECARVVLVEGGVERAREALAIARATRRRMRQNVAWALGYNVLAVPAAALGWLSPALAAAAMAASSLSVVWSSFRALPGGEPPARAA